MQADLFGNVPDPAEERSRATMWDVPRFAEVHRYNAIVVENVVDARQWVNWTAWLLAMRQLGYEYKTVFLNSMFAHPTPQSRDRMYVVFWRKGNKAPDLDIRPAAWCDRCGKDVEALQTWKAGKRFGRYRQQYVYSCPHCRAVVEPYYYCAASAPSTGRCRPAHRRPHHGAEGQDLGAHPCRPGEVRPAGDGDRHVVWRRRPGNAAD